MTEQLRQVSYPDHARFTTVLIEDNVPLARDTYRLRFRCPEIAERLVPGQFLMFRLPGVNDPLLGRPLALYDTVVDAAGLSVGVDIVYLAIGRMTRRLAALASGDPLEVWGPLGNGFSPEPTSHLLMVAGGIGQTPFVALAREYLGLRSYGGPARQAARAEKITLCYGARSKEYLAGVEDFRQMGVDVRISTDDGSEGYHGLVTDLIRPAYEENAKPCRVVCCGPEPMMEATSHVARELGLPCQVSLESPMACGIGICFSCVAKIRDATGEWDYRRTCVEGPIFDADRVEF